MIDVHQWPDWIRPLSWTFITLGIAWSVGRLASAIVMAHLDAWLRERPNPRLQTAAHVVRRRLPWWCLLIAIWLAAGYWPLTSEARLLIGRAVFVAAMASVTLAAAAVASRIVDSYGTVLAPALTAPIATSRPRIPRNGDRSLQS
jgi:hypothetical protein